MMPEGAVGNATKACLACFILPPSAVQPVIVMPYFRGMTNWDPKLPDPTGWQPRTKAAKALSQAFWQRCQGVEQGLLLRAGLERAMNIDNFDSGPGLEDMVREELARILPTRYAVRSGVVSDSAGRTAGDCDVILFNETWFPAIKAGAADASRRWHYPIEGVYGVIEVKQCLTAASLDAAMKKLIVTSRLDAVGGDSRLLVENRPAYDFVRPSPPVFSAILAAGIGDDQDLDDLVHRFVAINGQVPRSDVVNALCVLGAGFVTWGYQVDGEALPRTAYFLEEDMVKDIFPLFLQGPDNSYFYEFATLLLQYLHQRVLDAESVAVAYGAAQKARRPLADQWNLHP